MEEINTMNKTILDKYHKTLRDLIDLFYQTYYNDDNEPLDWDEWEQVGSLDRWIDIIEIHDDYWSITDMETALINNIPKKMLHSWYSDYLEHHQNNNEWNFTNLYNYWLCRKKK